MGAFPIEMFRHFCGRMYHLAIIRFVTNRQTDKMTDGRTDRQTTL